MPEPTTPKDEKKTGKNPLTGKNKWWWIAGGLVLLAVIFFAVRKSNQNTNAQQAQQPGLGASAPIDPATGFPEGSAADLAALGYSGTTSVTPTGGGIGTEGPAGPAGPIGPTGPAGPAGPAGPIGKTGPAGTSTQSGANKNKPPTRHPTNKGNTYYTVKAGDTLSSIAKRLYGNASLWPKIYAANKHAIGGNPNLIHTGLRLIIPGK